MITTNIVWDHRRRTPQNAEGPLEVRVTIDRRSYYINTKIQVRKSEWKAGIIVNRPDSDGLQKRLNIIYRRIEEEINTALDEGRPINVTEIKNRAWAVRDDNCGTALIEWIEEQVSCLTLREGTLKHYRTTVTRMKQFGGMLRWCDVTVENVCRFDAWLHTLTVPQSNGDRLAGALHEHISDSGVYTYHRCLKALLNRAVLFGKLERNPYDMLRGRFKRGDRERIDFLTDDEMEAFCRLMPVSGSKMAMARDLFVFQMYTGLSYSDALKFDISDYRMIDGVWRNTGERIKTGVAYTSQLLPPVIDVLERYRWHVPVMDNSDYNQCLKALGMACGIERRLHSHMARHTFATFMLRHGVPIEHVSKMLGHTNITQTQRYAKIVAQDIHDDFMRIAKAIERDKGR